MLFRSAPQVLVPFRNVVDHVVIGVVVATILGLGQMWNKRVRLEEGQQNLKEGPKGPLRASADTAPPNGHGQHLLTFCRGSTAVICNGRVPGATSGRRRHRCRACCTAPGPPGPHTGVLVLLRARPPPAYTHSTVVAGLAWQPCRRLGRSFCSAAVGLLGVPAVGVLCGAVGLCGLV